MSDQVVRKVNVERLSEEQIQNLSQQIGNKLADIINRAADEARAITKIYGFDVKLGYRLEPMEDPNKNS